MPQQYYEVPERHNLKGKTFGKWTVLYLTSKSKNPKQGRFWRCRCSCGNEKDVFAFHLKNGNSKSCGRCPRKGSSTRVTGLGATLRKMRLEGGFTQRKMAEVVGVTHCTISNLEINPKKTTVGTLAKYCEILGYKLKVVKEGK